MLNHLGKTLGAPRSSHIAVVSGSPNPCERQREFINHDRRVARIPFDGDSTLRTLRFTGMWPY